MLIGVGLGPGDPELLTVRAIRLITEADSVFVPGNVANTIVRPYRSDLTVLSFPMTDDKDQIQRSLEQNAECIAPAARSGLAVFGILGDPNFYGTFSRLTRVLKERYPDITCSTVPGISSITAFASVAGVSVSGGFEVSDGSAVSSKILLKVMKPKKIAEDLRNEGYMDFVLVERMCMEGERVYRNSELPEESTYFSVMYARK